MELINSISDFEAKLNKERMIPISATKLSLYKNVSYECGCGLRHDISGPECLKFAAAKTIKLLMRCNNDFYTFFKIKGLFRVRCETFWCMSANVVEREEGQDPYIYYPNKKSWIDFPTKEKANMMMLAHERGLIDD